MTEISDMSLKVLGSHGFPAILARRERLSLTSDMCGEITHSEESLHTVRYITLSIARDWPQFEMVAHMDFCTVRSWIQLCLRIGLHADCATQHCFPLRI